MKAIVEKVVTTEDDCNFGWLNLKLIPETEDEKELLCRVGDNHFELCDKEAEDPIIEIGDCTTSIYPSGTIDVEILFPKPTNL